MRAHRPLQVLLILACTLIGSVAAHAAKTPKDRLAAATAASTSISAALESAVAKRDAAKAEGNILAATCLNDAIGAIKGALKVVNEQTKALKEAIGQNDTEGQEHASQMISVSKTRAAGFSVEADTCVGDEDSYTGETEVVLNIDPDIREDSPNEVGPNDFIDFGQPNERGPEGAVRPANISGSE